MRRRSPTIFLLLLYVDLIDPSSSQHIVGYSAGNLRLNGTVQLNAGRLEVWYNGQWGTVCDVGFTNISATDACQSLGYTGGSSLPSLSYAPGSGPIWLDELKCGTNDTTNCTHVLTDANNCTHAQDQAISCIGLTNETTLTLTVITASATVPSPAPTYQSWAEIFSLQTILIIVAIVVALILVAILCCCCFCASCCRQRRQSFSRSCCNNKDSSRSNDQFNFPMEHRPRHSPAMEHRPRHSPAMEHRPSTAPARKHRPRPPPPRNHPADSEDSDDDISKLDPAQALFLVLIALAMENEDVEDEPYPPNWTHQEPTDNSHEKILLNPNSPEYRQVYLNISQSLHGTTIQIQKIERIENHYQYNIYNLRKKAIGDTAVNGDKVLNERTLWHGTSVTAIKDISENGFNRSYCGKNATAYGKGVYFARNFSYSADQTYSPRDVNGVKYIFQSKVLTGWYTLGTTDMKQPPPVKPGESRRFDSVVDKMPAPTIFVVFYDSQAYPEYLISFK